jgi:hypothetical protein
MPSPVSVSRVPSYRRHKPSGQAVVTLNGRDIYLASGTRRPAEPSMSGSWASGWSDLKR